MSNFFLRTVGGALFAAAVLLSLFLGAKWVGALMMLFTLIATKEFLRISCKANYLATTIATLTTSISIYLASYLYISGQIDSGYFWLLIPLYLAIVISILFNKKSLNSSNSVGYREGMLHLASLLYIAVPLSLTTTLLFDKEMNYTPYPLLALFLLLWAGDVGAYIVGVTLGKKGNHKLAPSISPKKSWEGFIGGALFTLVTMLLLKHFTIVTFPTTHSIAIATLLYLFSVLGDLFESLFKRNFNVKDSGSIIPGHGGVLDRIDGALFSFPITIAYIKFFQLL